MKFLWLGRLQCEVSLAGSIKCLWLGRLQCEVSLVGKVAV